MGPDSIYVPSYIETVNEAEDYIEKNISLFERDDDDFGLQTTREHGYLCIIEYDKELDDTVYWSIVSISPNVTPNDTREVRIEC